MIKSNDWQKIYRMHSPKLLGICRRYIQDIHTAEDILQDSFITAIQNIHQLKDEKMLFAWLKKIVINNALQYLRKSNKEIFIADDFSELTDKSFVMNTPEEKAHVLTYDFTQEELLSSIDSLPNHHKLVFNLYFIENYSHAEIANELGITVNTSKSHLLRAKKAVQNYLLNKVQPDTPKNRKKLTQLLVFFGFCSLLWGQTFRSKFSDFSVHSSKILEIPKQLTAQSYAVPSGAECITKKTGMIITGSAISTIILVSAFIFQLNYNSTSKSNIVSRSTEEERIQPAIEAKPLHSSVADIRRNGSKQNEQAISETDNTVLKEIKTPAEAADHINKGYHIPIKDTVKEEPPQKVIIVKKIIQRDTIYVER
ncbi:hypothetical protein BBH99_06755 [Chryseobacterium contaminans]|uniref:RNA polymerase sigma factor n=1 Tax=Chryseobacterium contaminans TaxID=1423959 RepID=A0A1M6ZX69_9FLAO|nr:RNA polymerase sigma factor [Chryseobacterium contaminans]OCA79071.1 hypothetical protein BBH99_06755 [Chryseobacterium contaminans]SHL34923.1 RNA polymerase sigma factor, sigma-70 family [Chryseobacterium contaminans]